MLGLTEQHGARAWGRGVLLRPCLVCYALMILRQIKAAHKPRRCALVLARCTSAASVDIQIINNLLSGLITYLEQGRWAMWAAEQWADLKLS